MAKFYSVSVGGELRTTWVVTGPGLSQPISGIQTHGGWASLSEDNARNLARALNHAWRWGWETGRQQR